VGMEAQELKNKRQKTDKMYLNFIRIDFNAI